MEPSSANSSDDADATSDLLERARAGDQEAIDLLFARHLPPLRRWATGRLPQWARDIADTTDLIQETAIAAMRQLGRFENRGDGALQAYLRQAVINRIRNEIRRRASRGTRVDVDSEMVDPATSPFEAAATRQRLHQYDEALERLGKDDRDAIVARVELGLSYAQIAELLRKPSANAARMAVVRALIRLTDEMP